VSPSHSWALELRWLHQKAGWLGTTLCTVGIVILPKERDPRFITIRRGGTLTDTDHRLLALWAATCAEHVLSLFESAQPSDPRPRHALEKVRAWTRGEYTMSQSRAAGGHATAARAPTGAARHAEFAAGQAAVVAHVAAHELGAAAYAIRAVRAAGPEDEAENALGGSDRSFRLRGHPASARSLTREGRDSSSKNAWQGS
jgi:hypothetical protein